MRTDLACLLLALVALAGCHAGDDARTTAQTTASPPMATSRTAPAPLPAAPVDDWESLMTEQSRTVRPPPTIGGTGFGRPVAPGGLMDDSGSGTIPGMVIDHSSPNRAAQFGSAEVVEEMEGRGLALDGYVVPLEMDDQGRVRELLFVSFYGACIHVPPPPPNQIIRVVLRHAIPVPELWEPFHLSGTLHIARFDADIASASYEARDATLSTISG